MAIEVFGVRWTKLQPFDKALNQAASQEGGIYSMFKLTGQRYRLYYIGMSKDLSKRFGTHRSNASHLMPETELKKLFVSFGLVSCFEQSHMTHDIPSSQLRQLESFLINTIGPSGNDDSTKKGYKGSPIIIFNEADTILRSLFKKEMSNCPELIKLLKYYL